MGKAVEQWAQTFENQPSHTRLDQRTYRGWTVRLLRNWPQENASSGAVLMLEVAVNAPPIPLDAAAVEAVAKALASGRSMVEAALLASREAQEWLGQRDGAFHATLVADELAGSIRAGKPGVAGPGPL
jgi:hypothetical protein